MHVWQDHGRWPHFYHLHSPLAGHPCYGHHPLQPNPPPTTQASTPRSVRLQHGGNHPQLQSKTHPHVAELRRRIPCPPLVWLPCGLHMTHESNTFTHASSPPAKDGRLSPASEMTITAKIYTCHPLLQIQLLTQRLPQHLQRGSLAMARHPPHFMYLMSHVAQGLHGVVLWFRSPTDRVSPLWVRSHCLDTSVHCEPLCFNIFAFSISSLIWLKI